MPKIQPFTIIKDTREQEGYTFEPSSSRYHKCNGMVTRKLDTGDYSLEGLEDKVCIERKASVVEFANNIGHDSVRFGKEIERIKEFPHRFIILEFSLSDLMNFPEGSSIPEDDWDKLKVTNKFMLKKIMEYQMYDNIHVMFCDSKKNAKWTVLSILKRVNELYEWGD
jgi:ERCC4-type nuclease